MSSRLHNDMMMAVVNMLKGKKECPYADSNDC